MSELISDPRRTAVVVIDLQKGIVGFPGNPHSAENVIANTVALLDAARSMGAQPILVHVGRSPDGGDGLQVASDQPMRAAGSMPPDWSELIPELNRQPNDIVILKRQWGAFYGTDLDLQLRRRSLSTIILCGIATEFGVESTARDAYERGFEQVFAEDAMTARNAESHTNSIANIFPRMGRVRSTTEIVTALRGDKSTA
ncbi:MAG: hydrolase [Terracidiphilus sp.]|jgi:nicotinamidase-related amidase